ncbi:MAG: lysylphosphatidylglycerol synthase transmembrane domain-containing protein, partial [Bacteroidia bacterium]
MKRKVWQVLLGLGVGAAFFYWAFQGFSWEEVLHIRVDGIYLLGASGAMLSAHFLRAWRWVLYAQVSSPHKPPVGLFFHALMAGYAVNQILPRVGELVRCTLLSRVSPLSLVMLLGTVVAERVIDILSLGVVLLTLLVGDWARIVALLDLSGRLNPMGMV